MGCVKVSTRGDYAARALLSMALHGYDRPTSVKEIAERTGLPQPYLEQILLAVKGAGMARSKRGVGGGYVLARPPEEITLADIVAAADGPITTSFDSHDHREGRPRGASPHRPPRCGREPAGAHPPGRTGGSPRAVRTAARSGGSGSVNSRRSPVAGWRRARKWAWRNGRPGWSGSRSPP